MAVQGASNGQLGTSRTDGSCSDKEYIPFGKSHNTWFNLTFTKLAMCFAINVRYRLRAGEKEMSRHRRRASYWIDAYASSSRYCILKLLSNLIFSITLGSPWRTFWRSLAEVHRIAAVVTGRLKAFAFISPLPHYNHINPVQSVTTQCH